MFRKPVKSSLLLLVIVAVSLSLLCGMACQNASIQTQDTTRQAVGAGLRLDGNESNRTKRLEETTDKITHQPGYLDEGEWDGVYIRKLETAYGTQWYVGADNSFDSLLMDDIEKLAAAPKADSIKRVRLSVIACKNRLPFDTPRLMKTAISFARVRIHMHSSRETTMTAVDMISASIRTVMRVTCSKGAIIC